MVKDTQHGQSKMVNEGIKKAYKKKVDVQGWLQTIGVFFCKVTFFLHAGLCKGQMSQKIQVLD